LAAIDRLVFEGGPSSTARPYHARLIDPMVLVAACGVFETSLDEMCRNFKSDTPSLIADLSDARKDHDAPRLHEAAHKIYGTITALSTVGRAVASDLEDLAVRGQLDEARPLADDSKRWSGNSSRRSTACRSRLCEARSGLRANLTGQSAPENEEASGGCVPAQPPDDHQKRPLLTAAGSIQPEQSFYLGPKGRTVVC
jgi:hypothetical protein